MPETVFVAGASVRSIAQSAVRVGFHVAAADLFGDRDLRACARTETIEPFPEALLPIARRIEPCNWLYTGALENWANLVEKVSQYHRLWGNGPDVLRQVRDPFAVHDSLTHAGFSSPLLSRRPPLNDAPRKWLCKPFRSCGGRSIDFVAKRWQAVADARAAENSGQHYYQRYVDGRPYGVLYVAAQGKARFLGVTRQLNGCHWAGAPSRFAHVGSIGPLQPSAALAYQLRRVGTHLAAHFQLQGLFGVDVVVRGERIWTVEVNPRYTASVEVHERALEIPMLDLHRRACEDETLPGPLPNVSRMLVGKAVIYAPGSGVISEQFCQWIDSLNTRTGWCNCADLPQRDVQIGAGAPLLTIFAQGASLGTVTHQLRGRAQIVATEFLKQTAEAGATPMLE